MALATTLGLSVAVNTVGAPANASVWNSCKDAASKVLQYFYWVDTVTGEETGTAVQPDGLLSYHDLEYTEMHRINIPADDTERVFLSLAAQTLERNFDQFLLFTDGNIRMQRLLDQRALLVYANEGPDGGMPACG
ncbi:hypothetical protein [Amycolatopsis sp. PS_44_ISF1]|uniref:hypothetical protein n=1 Tax=Amycolatopsis sp. PS_44_ISF1 TaxID=2974917 RepID=UPI0028DE4CB9|nr:hypothetical protein [Amycolatopsis sp. PS_44_ISF1]MDT8912309.1 hypothetical protein [Amycolatopsis sp. PS_44_ISF1]